MRRGAVGAPDLLLLLLGEAPRAAGGLLVGARRHHGLAVARRTQAGRLRERPRMGLGRAPKAAARAHAPSGSAGDSNRGGRPCRRSRVPREPRGPSFEAGRGPAPGRPQAPHRALTMSVAGSSRVGASAAAVVWGWVWLALSSTLCRESRCVFKRHGSPRAWALPALGSAHCDFSLLCVMSLVFCAATSCAFCMMPCDCDPQFWHRTDKKLTCV